MKFNSQFSKVVACALVSSELPYSILPHDEFSHYLKDIWFLSKYLPFLLKFFLYMDVYRSLFAEPEKYTSTVMRDKEKYYQHEEKDLDLYLKTCVRNLREGMNQSGVKELVREIKMERNDWGYDFLKITKIPIYMFHGKKDQLIPIKLVRRFANKLPTSHLVEYEKKGNFFWMNDESWSEILSSLNKHF